MTETASVVTVAPARFGMGLFAAREIAAGERFLQLSGRQHSGAELDALGFTPGYPLQVGDSDYVLLEAPGVYCNHSCDPNAGIDADLMLRALRPIAAGEEICFDYSTTMHEDNAWTLRCGCGSAQCRGLVEDFERLSAPLRSLRLQQNAVLPFIARRHQG
jgi:hypothetical protein